MKLKRFIILPILISALTFGACTSSDAKKAAQAAQDIGVSINILIEAKRDLLAQGVITNAQAIQIDQVLLELNSALRVFAQGVDKWQKGQLNKAGLVQLFGAVNKAVQDLNNKGVLQLTDPKAKATLSSVTATLAVSLGVIQGVLGIPAS